LYKACIKYCVANITLKLLALRDLNQVLNVT
jgi:hypothetical protein